MPKLPNPTRWSRILLLAAWLIAAVGAEARTIHVAKDGSGADGQTWQTAYTTITDAVIASTTGDSIWVKGGVYGEAVEVTKEISLFGGFSGVESDLEFGLRDILTNVTKIDSRGIGKSTVTIRNVTGVLLDGFYLTGTSFVGGGVKVVEASPTINMCYVVDCFANIGGGVYFERSGGHIMNTVIINNGSTDSGGGIHISDNSYPSIVNTIIAFNESATAAGIAAAYSNRRTSLINCSIVANTATSTGGVYAGIALVEAFNCIIVNNEPEEVYESASGGTVNVTYSNIQGGWPGEGNIDADPLFMDPENGDFRLQENSPCIDSASTVGPMTDIDGNERPVDIPGVGRDGTGDEFDMGPYERLASGNPTFTPTFTPTPTNTPTVTPTPTSTPTPKVLYVAHDASPGGDGRSWENAFQEIRTAVLEAVNWDTIYVKQGHYDERIRFSKALTLLGGFKGDEEEGDIEGRDPKSCGVRSNLAGVASLVIDRQEDNRFLVDGFTFYGTDDGTSSSSGAFVDEVTGIFSNVIFTEGFRRSSGGGLGTWGATVVIRDSTFTNNRAREGGGGMYFETSEVDLYNCVIVDNTAAYGYVGQESMGAKGLQTPYWGGGILGKDSIIRATNCVIERNDALSGGGVCVFEASSEIHLVSCSISKNTASLVGAMIASTLDPVSLTNCLIARNLTRSDYPALLFDGRGDSAFVRYCTIADNSASASGGAIHSLDRKEIHVENTILWGNSPNEMMGVLDLTEVSNSIVDGGHAGVGNLDADPRFRDPEQMDYRLDWGSAAIDAASVVGPSFDLDGNTRPVDTPGVGREGENAYDIGAYERQDLPTPTPTFTPSPTPTFKSSDIDGDGHVDAIDLLILLEDMADPR